MEGGGETAGVGGWWIYRGEAARDVPRGVRRVKVGPSVAVIPRAVFWDHDSLAELDLSGASALTEIKEEAFYECSALTGVLCLPSGLQRIGSRAFSGCPKLKGIDCAGATALREIRQEAFYGCRGLGGTLHLPPGLRVIGIAAFAKASSLGIVDFSNAESLEVVEEEAFRSCSSLADTLRFPPRLGVVGKSAFADCRNLQKVDLSDAQTLTTIEDLAFWQCSSLTEAILPSSVTFLGDNCFSTEFLEGGGTLVVAGNGELALGIHLAVLYPTSRKDGDARCTDNLVASYARQPIRASELWTDEPGETRRLKEIRAAYLRSVLAAEAAMPLSFPEQHGWVAFLAGDHLPEGTAESNEVVRFFETGDNGRVRSLAEARDRDGRVALRCAQPHLRRALEERLLFLSRYGLAVPLRHTVAGLVVRAEDARAGDRYGALFEAHSQEGGLDEAGFREALRGLAEDPSESWFPHVAASNPDDHTGRVSRASFIEFCEREFGRDVAIHFLRQKVSFEKEREARRRIRINGAVVSLLESYDLTTPDSQGAKESLAGFLSPLGQQEAEEFGYVVVMASFDQSLEEIFRNERWTPGAVRHGFAEVVRAVADLHAHDLVHGNLAMDGIVRVRGRLRLADLGTASATGTPIGAVPPTGVLPPEFLERLEDPNDLAALEDYHQSVFGDSVEHEKKGPVLTQDHQHAFAWRSFATTEGTPRMNGLPFPPLEAHPSLDAWALGVILYRWSTGRPLFWVNCDGDIDDGPRTAGLLQQLYDWDGTRVEEEIEGQDLKDLLGALLHRDPKKRPTMREALSHSFFSRINESEGEKKMGGSRSKLMERAIAESQQTQTEDHEVTNPVEVQEVAQPVGNEEDLVEEALVGEGLVGEGLVVEEEDKATQMSFTTLREYRKRAIEYIVTLRNDLDSILDGTTPKFFVVLPRPSSDKDLLAGYEQILDSAAQREDSASQDGCQSNEIRLVCVCPLMLRPVVGGDGEPFGYDVSLPNEWLKSCGFCIMFGLKVLQLGLATGRWSNPAPQPESDSETSDLSRISNLISRLEESIMSELVNEEEEDGAVAGILEKVGSGKELSKKQKDVILESYQCIIGLIEDKELDRCGLSRAVNGEDGWIEFLHPDAAPMYSEVGPGCFQKSFSEIDRWILEHTKRQMEALKEAQTSAEEKFLEEEKRSPIQDSISKQYECTKRLIRYQHATRKILNSASLGIRFPKYFVVLPHTEGSGFQDMVDLAEPQNWIENKAKLVFICPITLQPVLDTSAEAIGYEIELPKDWIETCGTALLFGLRAVQLGFAVGRGFGFPVPPLREVEDTLLESSDFFFEMEKAILQATQEGAAEESPAGEIAFKIFEKTDTDEPYETALTEAEQSLLLRSYSRIGELIKDEGFQGCGLVKTVGKDRCIDFVHPDAVPLFTRLGEDCYDKSLGEIDHLLAIDRNEEGSKPEEVEVPPQSSCCTVM